jgi:hypothetical protein
MTDNTFQEAFDAGFDAVKGYVDRSFAAFEKRVAAIEQRGAFRYAGTYEAERQYSPGEFVTHDGSMWHCERSTKQKPGTCADWTLAVKRGRDGGK